MAFFKNFLVVILLVGLLTQLLRYFLQRVMKKRAAVQVAFLIAGLLLFPFYFFIGFDVVVVELLPAFVVWLGFDLLRLSVKGEK
jgi:hypothetical protein